MFALSTEFSHHSLELSVNLRGVIKGCDRKLGIFDAHVKIGKLDNSFCRKTPRKKSEICRKYSYFF